ncbi:MULTISPECIES: hypothetical protein [unclassified Serratia (in: enterobacteria)]|uniref:hypothetical protein n=1 Tax=unclassified Serratia (in: enterobacteria) TaxID=2647522 RepID=UPI003B430EB6
MKDNEVCETVETSKDMAIQLYWKIREVSGWFIQHVNTKALDELRNFNPSFDEIAQLAEQAVMVIKSLLHLGLWEDERVILNAQQATTLMQQIAEGITKDDRHSVKDGAERLSQMDFF